MNRLFADRAVAYGILAKIWQSGATLVTLGLISRYFAPEIQGFYYTFLSLLALQVFVELGLGFVVAQFASHEWAKLSLDSAGGVAGDAGALSRLASLARFALAWYGAAGVLTALILGPAGSLFFERGAEAAPGLSWKQPWIVLCCLSGANLALAPLWLLIEGCNQVREVYFYRLISKVLSALCLWTAIVLGAGLWAACATAAVEAGWSALRLWSRHRVFLRAVLARPQGPRIGWRSEIWRMQWKMAASFLSGYFIYYLFTPLLFRLEGAAAAGRMGMTWSLVSGVSVVASTFVFTKMPQFGMFVARRDYAELDRLFWRSAAAAMMVSLGASLAAGLGVCALSALHWPLGERLLPPLPTALLLAAGFLMQASLCLSCYLRAHKEEPLVAPSAAQAVLTAVSSWFLGRRFGAAGMAAGYLAIVAVIVLPWVAWIWTRRRQEWHAPA